MSPVLSKRQRPADESLRRDVQDAGAIAGAAHARVRDAQHVAMALPDQRLGDRQHAPFRHAGTAERPGIAQHQHMVRGNVEILVVDRRLHLGIAVEHQRRTLMDMEFRVAGGGLHDRAVRREVALDDRQRAFVVDRIVERADDVVIVDDGALQGLAQVWRRTP